jgi:hypothetical protein
MFPRNKFAARSQVDVVCDPAVVSNLAPSELLAR